MRMARAEIKEHVRLAINTVIAAGMQDLPDNIEAACETVADLVEREQQISYNVGRGYDEDGYDPKTYQSCNNGEYEGSTSLYCRHLERVHGVPSRFLSPFKGGVTQGTWILIDELHRTYLKKD